IIATHARGYVNGYYIFSYIPNLETLYEAIIRPPPILLRDVA
ncbi:MAG: hypothetical protein ACD_16C00001G0001, partial [uncultured bacterium]